MKHLDVLREAGLVKTRSEGRLRINSLNVAPIRQILERWISKYEAYWANTLLRVKDSAEAGASERGRTRSKPRIMALRGRFGRGSDGRGGFPQVNLRRTTRCENGSRSAMRARVRGTEIYFDVDGMGLAPTGDRMDERPVLFLLHGGAGRGSLQFQVDGGSASRRGAAGVR